jgi:hypothetical protein
MNNYTEILNIIEALSQYLPEYISLQLRKGESLELISRIISESGKKPIEAVILMVAAVKYTAADRNIFLEMEKNDSFLQFIKSRRRSIIRTAIEKGPQANLPGRALPLMEVLNKYLRNNPVGVIELGASYGLIGQCLLYSHQVIENKERYFSPTRHIPLASRPIDSYLGIDLNCPAKEWLFAFEWNPDSQLRLENFINEVPRPSDKFKSIQASAFGFSELEPVKSFIARSLKIVILTSFFFFQFDEEKKELLRREIQNFMHGAGAHWINQCVEISPSSSGNARYFIQWDGMNIIELADDKCTNWKWLKAGCSG